MRKIVKVYDARDPLPPDVARYISRAHYKDGCIYLDYWDMRENKRRGSLVLVCFEDKKPVGWCLYASYYRSAQFWTSQKYRRTGVGTKLYKELKKRKKRFHVFMPDEAAEKFFESNGKSVGSYSW